MNRPLRIFGRWQLKHRIIFLAHHLCFIDEVGEEQGKVFLGIVAAALVSAILMAVLYVPGQDPTRVYYGTDTACFLSC